MLSRFVPAMPGGWPRVAAYGAAAAVPIGLTFLVAWLDLPPFVFEHTVVLLVLAVAIRWWLGPAVVTALVSVVADNLLLRQPVGRPTISGYRDVLDLSLFALVAVIVSSLVTRAREARRAAEDAAARERMAREERDRLIATVAHDLATPLAVLGGTVQMARRRGVDAERELPRLLARVETASARASALVRTLADVQALESEEIALRMDVHDLRALVAPIAEMMDRVSDGHPVTLAAAEHPVYVRADADRLRRVVENLVSNAIKYSPNGGKVEVTIGLEARQAVFRVRDHGMGISPQALPHVFDRSFRAPEAERHAPGLGLGLSIAAQVVARHGGVIQAQAADGGGTVVTVTLPVANPHAIARDGGAAERTGAGEPARAPDRG